MNAVHVMCLNEVEVHFSNFFHFLKNSESEA